MHEYDITQNIINTVLKEAKKNNVNKVTSIKLVVGELSGVVDECIQMYFDVLSENTVCQGSKLKFKKIKAKLKCKKCDILFDKNNYFICPNCGEAGGLTNMGQEFYIESIEVE